jgi:hypothetical protein
MSSDERALSAEDRAILDLERTWWQGSKRKEQAILERLGLTPAVYYRRRSRLVERPEAMDYDPMVVRRLQRLRDRRRRVRVGGVTYEGGGAK